MSNDKNFEVLNHPIAEHYLAILRDKSTCCDTFRNAVKKVGYLLSLEAIKNLKLKEVEIETPLEKMNVKKVDTKYEFIISPILRAGLIFCDDISELLPFATVCHIGMYRDEKTLHPVWYLDKTKKQYKNPENVFVYLLDPMLATGNSGKSAIGLYVEKGIPQENITFVSLIAAPIGVENIHSSYPDVRIIAAAYDRELNSNGYILPGIGDAGDRIFNTLY